ncbi:3357_t:CDS:1, partial [Acaulospora morrowiae]
MTEETTLKEMTPCACKAIYSLYAAYCASGVPFTKYHLFIIGKAASKDIIIPFFDYMGESLKKDE